MPRYYFIVIMFVLIFTPITSAYAQEQQTERPRETLSIPFEAANVDLDNVNNFQFNVKHKDPWILNIENKLLYNKDNPDAKIVMRFYGDREGKHFIEIIMSNPSKGFFAVSFNNEDGYFRLYGDDNSWDPAKQPVRITLSDGRLSVYNGIRIVTDEINLRSEVYDLNGMDVFGKDAEERPTNALGGQVNLEIISSVQPHWSYVYFLPYMLMAVGGGVVAFLIKLKKR